MSDIRQQLLGLGFKEATPAKPRHDGRRNAGPGRGKPAAGKAPGGAAADARQEPRERKGRPNPGDGTAGRKRSRGEIDLAKAYAIRAQKEKDERIAAEKEKQEQARRRREARARLAAAVEGKVLNAEDAEIARHFEYGGKIKRIYVTAAQLKELNAGQLGVLQLNGRYLLVTAEMLGQAAEIFPEAVALKVDPHAPAGDDPYADPKYQVPDDLVW